MPSVKPKFTFRTDQEIIDKLRYIADDNFRTLNKELEMIAIKRISEYEKEHGQIQLHDNSIE